MRQVCKVSVIVPAFNAVGTIGQTLESLRSQSFRDWEAIVVDDGSHDATFAVAEAAAFTDDRIVVMRRANCGVATARNAALASARGTFVLFLDADDTLHPEHLANLTNGAQLHKQADVVYCDWRVVGHGGNQGEVHRPELALGADATFARTCALPIHAALTRRERIIALGGFQEKLRLCEDWDLWQRLAFAGAVFRHTPGTVADYRLSPGSATSDLAGFLSAALTLVRQGHAGERPWSGNLARAETELALWLAGRAIGAGHDALSIVKSADFTPDMTYDAASAAVALLDGMTAGMADPTPDWCGRWVAIRPALMCFLQAVAPSFALPEFAALTLRHSERTVLRRMAASANTNLGVTMVRMFDLGESPSAVEARKGFERLLGIVKDGATEVGRFEMSIQGNLTAEALAAVLADFAPAPLAAVDETPAEAGPLTPDYWETVFDKEDPWAYDNPYETLKYEQTLDAIPGMVGMALEIACAEGHFTRLLAGRVRQLVATDISATAVERARQRCRDLSNLSFAVLDVLTDPLPAGQDLIVCSEMLYYIEDADEIALIADRIAAALSPGGMLVMTHANLASDKDEDQLVAFDWGHRFGALTIGRIFANCRNLSMIEERRSDLYRIQVFQRVDGPTRPADPRILSLPYAREIPHEVLRHIDWSGYAPEAYAAEPEGVPVLMYHRITSTPLPSLARYATSPEKFRAQMLSLAENGYNTISVDALEAAIWDGTPLPARAVAITFDDGYLDNLTEALPILKEFGQTATIFIPTAHVGLTSDWDRLYGGSAPLMTWDQLAEVRDAGLTLAAHGTIHRPLPALDPSALSEALAMSKDHLASRLSIKTRSIAYPYGMNDEAVQRAALAHGYRLAFTTEDRRWRGNDRVMAMPRVEISGTMTMESFTARLRAK